MKHMTKLGAALLAALTAHSALAGDTAALEPGLHFAWTFGAQEQSRPTLSLGLYPNDLGWRRLWADAGVGEVSQLDKPAVFDLRTGDSSGLHMMGLPLNAQSLGLNASDGEASGGSFLKPVLIVLAAGVATALVIGSAGDAAEDNNPAVNVNGSGNGDGGDGDGGGGTTGVGPDGVGCVNGECAVPCETTNTCSDGG
ncbi:MAG: hypothetical protein WC809_18400 [Sinimarinibacterium sp.]|jgi:hypothetical protein